jgi:YCII-related domain
MPYFHSASPFILFRRIMQIRRSFGKEQLGGIGVLEARDMNHAIALMSQHPALKYGTIWEIRPAGDMSEIIKASEQRRGKNTAR